MPDEWSCLWVKRYLCQFLLVGCCPFVRVVRQVLCVLVTLFCLVVLLDFGFTSPLFLPFVHAIVVVVPNLCTLPW